MTVLVDSKTTAAMTNVTAATITDATQTIVSASTMLLACLMFQNGATPPASIALTANGAGMTPLTGGSAGNSTSGNMNYFWLNARPATGTLTLIGNWTGSIATYIWAVAFTGADLTGDTTTFTGFNSNTGATTSPCSVTITSASGTIAVAGHVQDGGTWTTTTGTSIGTSTTLPQNGAASYITGAAPNVAVNYSYNAPATFLSAGVNVAAAGGAAAPSPLSGIQGMTSVEWRRKDFSGWRMPLGDHRRRVLRPNRSLWLPPKLILPFKRAA